ncbi:Uncharacterized protein {ECO:0000313/EMBL:CCF09876.1} [Pantoea ananatis]|nr:Uncharacterized protein {ECO:0000313/EMBL:CCF09876.1} [Pantoea ananatis]CRH38152.1 Uncharacterized protein {ECO:0000313/EMBL:CCF09876.1} [Pantoea ananatis]
MKIELPGLSNLLISMLLNVCVSGRLFLQKNRFSDRLWGIGAGNNG